MNPVSEKMFYRATQGDRLLAALLIGFAIGGLCAQAYRHLVAGRIALIQLGTAQPQSLDLTRDQRITMRGAGQPMELEVSQGRICIRESTCPNKLCQHRGWISRPGEMIVCLPNSVLVEITESTEQRHCDAVSY